jgi:hypothetical protein
MEDERATDPAASLLQLLELPVALPFSNTIFSNSNNAGQDGP